MGCFLLLTCCLKDVYETQLETLSSRIYKSTSEEGVQARRRDRDLSACIPLSSLSMTYSKKKIYFVYFTYILM